MIPTLQDTFKQTIRSALETAVQTDQPVLVSHVSEIDPMGPFAFFAAGKENFQGERFFWRSPSSRQAFAGLGIAHEIASEDKTSKRFMAVEKEWKRLTKLVFYKDESSKSNAYGPLLLGGFSFDPYKNSRDEWTSYKEARFILPKCMHSKTEKGSFYTINKIVHREDTLEECIQYFEDYQLYSVLGESSEAELPRQISCKEHMKEEWLEAIIKATDAIKAGELDKVVLARDVTLVFDEPVQAEAVLERLMEEQKTSYIFAMENEKSCFLGATPERLVKKEGESILSTCLAGSIKRGQSEEEDIVLGETLLSDKKNLEEHGYVVQMIKSALENCCESVSVPQEPGLYKTKSVQHLFTPVEGRIKEGCSLLNLVEMLHPTPALGGLPKEKAVEMIRAIEPMDRGWYAGPIGWFDAGDNGEFAVAIRSSLIKGKDAHLYAGCGIVRDSEPEAEYAETMIKLRPMLSSLGGKIE